MDEATAARYWCHMCSQMVNPTMEVEIKCPFCQSGFVEEMSPGSAGGIRGSYSDFGTSRGSSLRAPILLGMMGNPPRPRRSRRMESGDDGENDNGDARHVRENDLDELEDILRRTRRRSAAILHLLQEVRAGFVPDSENYESDMENVDRDRGRERERVILINPFNQTIMVQGSYDSNPSPVGSLGDYFIGSGFDLLLQHLAENDPNKYGTPPAQKEVVEAMPNVKIEEALQCSVCLDEFEIGTEAKEMPCKHKFHDKCILPWLELHSSCPVCRYQLPADETKGENERSRNNLNGVTYNSDDNNNGNGNASGGEGDQSNGNERRLSLPWPLSILLSLSRDTNSSSDSGSRSATDSEDEN